MVQGAAGRTGRSGMWHLGVVLLLVVHVAGSSADGVAPREAEQISLEAQAAAASAVATEQVDYADSDGGARDADGEEGDELESIYSKDGTWTLPAAALTAGAACMPHCTGICMEHCQFKANPATGLVEDSAPCSSDCKRMCRQGCRREPAEAGGKQHEEGLAEEAASEAEANAHDAATRGGSAQDELGNGNNADASIEQGHGGGGGDQGNGDEDDGDDTDGANALIDGVGANDESDKGDIPLKDCIPACLAECFPQCERPSTKDPHICKGDCNSYCARDCKMQQGERGDDDKEPLPEDPHGVTFEYMSVDDAVLPHQSPKMVRRPRCSDVV